jgi:hypothetical protein
MLDTERQFFEENREDLLRKFPGKFVVIKEQLVLGSFESIEDALAGGAAEYGLTSFLVRRTDQVPEDAAIPALMLGLLRADSPRPTDGSGTNP